MFWPRGPRAVRESSGSASVMASLENRLFSRGLTSLSLDSLHRLFEFPHNMTAGSLKPSDTREGTRQESQFLL